ncbi:phage holin family protein [Pseudonocardia asaccharolytica]|uniref:phage holin family protein n=1 Tax=Pseudonocardia asaccharolytica TaxID=54010 RepID=UPI00040394B0|nr:phage holin family protein [Pseudonocardia asaccharolytica]
MASSNSSSGTDVPPVLPSIPLSAEPARAADQSIGALARDVTTHVSSLIRSEVELAKAEVSSEVRKGLQGSVFFVTALVIALFSLFFFFFAVAEALALVLSPPIAFAITFGIMLLIAGLAGLLGYLRVRKIRKPERTISSLKESAQVFSGLGGAEAPERNGQHAAGAR